jgi:hypothetical protein
MTSAKYQMSPGLRFKVAAYECAIYTDPANGLSSFSQKDAERLGGTYVSDALA